MYAAGADNDNANPNNIIFTIKDTKLYVRVVTLSAKSEIKNTTNEYRYFLVFNFVEVNKFFALTYLNRNNNVKPFNARKYYLSKVIVMTLSSMEKTVTTKQLILM